MNETESSRKKQNREASMNMTQEVENLSSPFLQRSRSKLRDDGKETGSYTA